MKKSRHISRVFILTEGGAKIGFGHITRCIALYQAFRAKGVKPEFFVNLTKRSKFFSDKKDFKVFNWLLYKNRFFKSLVKNDIVIIDSYKAGITFYREISKRVRLAVYLDDCVRLNYPKGIVINGVVGGEKLRYPKNKDVVYLLGQKYSILRKEFWKVPKKKNNKRVKNILITLGGKLEYKNLTLKIVKFLDKEYPEFCKYVVSNSVSTNLSSKRIKVIVSASARKMKDLMLESDIAISASGQTLNELARIGVPTIAIGVAENQKNNIKGFMKGGSIKFAGWHEDSKILNKIENCMCIMGKDYKRKKVSNAGRKLIDGMGAKRIVDLLEKENG